MRRDLRELDTPENMALDASWKKTTWLVCSGCRNAVDEGSTRTATAAGQQIYTDTKGVRQPQPKPIAAYAGCGVCDTSVWDVIRSSRAVKSPHTSLIIARSIGSDHAVDTSPAGQIARTGGTTRESVQATLDGEDPTPIPTDLKPCPLAAFCDTLCAQVQLSEQRNFPLTASGRWQDCEYREFLTAIGDHKDEENIEKYARLHNLARENGGAQTALI